MTDQLTESVDSMSLDASPLDYEQMISLQLFKDEQISWVNFNFMSMAFLCAFQINSQLNFKN